MKGGVGPRWKLPTLDGTSRWGAYYKQAGAIFEMNNSTDLKWRALKIIEGLRGKAMEDLDTLLVEVGKDGELLCREMCSRFGDNKPGLSPRSKLCHVAQKGGNHRRIHKTNTTYDNDGISFLGKSRGCC